MKKYEAAKVGEIREGQKKRIVLENRAIMLAMVEGKYFAVDDKCTHSGASLSSGTLKDYCIECPWHGAKFDLRTGEVKALPAAMALNSYRTWTEDGKIWVELS